MSKMGSHVGLETPGAVSQLDWEQLLQSLVESPSLRKRNRPTSFDAVSSQFQDGESPFWGEHFLNGGGAEDNLAGRLFGGYGERVDSFTTDSADSGVCAENYGLPPRSLLDDSDPLAVYGRSNSMANFRQQASEPFPPPSAAPPFRRQVSDPLPKTSPAVEKLAPTRPRKFMSKSMTTEEIHKAYAQSWGGASKTTPAGGNPLARTTLLAKPPEKLKRAESKAERSANEAKAEAANIIRDLFRRPGAKRQAVPLEGGQIGSLERGLGQLSAQTVAPQVRNPQKTAPIRTGSNNSDENVISPAESHSESFLPAPTRAQAVPTVWSAAPLDGKTLKAQGAFSSSGGANDLASLQKEAQVLLESMGGAVGHRKPPPGKPQIVITLERASHSEGGSKQSQECPLLRAVDVAGCQVALACPMELDAELLFYDPWEKIGEACPAPPAERGGFDRLGSFGGLGDLGGFDWLPQAESGLGSGRPSADGPPAFIGESNTWSPGFSDVLGEVGGSTQEPDLTTLPSARWSEATSAPERPTPRLSLHHLWAQLEPGQIREPRFRTYRTAYKEEIRRLRIWAATFVGEPLLPAVADLHFLSCNALPNLQDRHIRMMLTKGALWTAFVNHSLRTASPADVYFARHEGQDAYKGRNRDGLDNMTVGMQLKCKNMCFLAEDLKDEAAYGPEIFRTYGALHKSLGPTRAPPAFGFASQQITFPELTDPKPTTLNSADPTSIEPIEFDNAQVATNGCAPDGASLPWGMWWVNRQRLLSTGRGLRGAGEPARAALQTLFERVIDAHVEKYDVMATGTPPTLDRYLAYARDELGTAVSLGLAFCAIGQGLADAGRWEPMLDDVEQLFEEARTSMELAGNVVRIMSDLRTYQDDLVQLRFNAVAIRMREAYCSQKEALDFLIARASRDIEALGAEIKGHASKSVFARACWRLSFEVCRVAVALFTILGSESRGDDLFEKDSFASRE